jgi:hypothetical protein
VRGPGTRGSRVGISRPVRARTRAHHGVLLGPGCLAVRSAGCPTQNGKPATSAYGAGIILDAARALERAVSAGSERSRARRAADSTEGCRPGRGSRKAVPYRRGVGGAPIGPAGPSNQLAIVGPGPDHLVLTHPRPLVRLLDRRLTPLSNPLMRPVSMPERQHHVRGGDHRGRPASETPEARAESRRSPQGSPRCHATTRAGGACLVRVEPSKARCRFHGGPSTGPRIEEGRARIAEAQRRRSRLSGQRVHQISWRLSAWADRLLLTHWRPLVRLLDVGYPRLVARRNRTSEFAKRMSESGV